MEPKQERIFAPRVRHDTTEVFVYSLNFIVLQTHDIQRSRDFYEALGLRFQQFEYGSIAKCISGSVPVDAPLVLDARREGIPPPHVDLEIHSVQQDETIHPLKIGFFVNSVDKAVKAAIEHGGSLLDKPANWPYGRRAAVADPDGNRIELSDSPSGRLTGDYPS